MTSDMPQECADYLAMLARKSPAREVCGFVMKSWVILPIDNISANDYQFHMNEEQQLHVFCNYRDEIVGVYHSHPSGSDFPSDRDIEVAPRRMRYWIVTQESVTEWVIADGIATTVVAPIHCSAAEVRSASDPVVAESGR
jgi:proteasome lid subunit RPN8/RPN11